MTVQAEIDPATIDPAEWRMPCEVYSRVVGYLRPVDNWNRGKQEEYSERVTFNVPEGVDKGE
jgi:hypothetical protein